MARPSGSSGASQIAGSRMCVHCSAPGLLKMWPVRSSSCHRVWMTITVVPGCTRVMTTELNQFQTSLRFVGLWASLKSLCGSSTMMMSPGLPVRPVPTPAVIMPPPTVVSHSSRAVTSLASLTSSSWL